MRPGICVRATSLASAIVLAAAAFFSTPTELTAQVAPTVTVNPTNVLPGATVTVTIANGPGNATDWVGIYSTTAPDTVMSDWKYLNGSRTPPAVGITSATLTFAVPSTVGTYNVRFYAMGGYTRLARRARSAL